MNRNKTASQKNFAISPAADVPRSKLAMRQTRKQAFNASDLIPIMVEEVLPGDTWQHTENIMARFATPIAPAIDDINLETFYFFVPNRISWNQEDWEAFITGTDDALTLPTMNAVNTGVNHALKVGSVLDHMGLPPATYANDLALKFNALPVWAYFKIYNEWFRDQNLQEEWTWSPTWTTGQSDDIHLETTIATKWDQMPLRANKKHDYITSSLPWAQKGAAVELPLGSTAPVYTSATDTVTGVQASLHMRKTDGNLASQNRPLTILGDGSGNGTEVTAGTATAATADSGQKLYPSNLYADLANATAATINQIRLAFQTQKLLERDARGGSRYIEQIFSHFRVKSSDQRLQRPEYLGGSTIPVNVNPVAQTGNYDSVEAYASGLGNLGAEMNAHGRKKTFTYAAEEHGYIIGLAVVRAKPTYQQGVRRHWIARSTRLEFFWPVFSALGEQAVQTREIYQTTNNTYANQTWGYQERWAEYRYTPNEITGVLRSQTSAPLDWWHYAEEFGSEPALNDDFITDKTKETLARSQATYPTAQWSAQIIMDILHENNVARLMPTYSVPGLIDHF